MSSGVTSESDTSQTKTEHIADIFIKSGENNVRLDQLYSAIILCQNSSLIIIMNTQSIKNLINVNIKGWNQRKEEDKLALWKRQIGSFCDIPIMVYVCVQYDALFALAICSGENNNFTFQWSLKIIYCCILFSWTWKNY